MKLCKNAVSEMYLIFIRKTKYWKDILQPDESLANGKQEPVIPFARIQRTLLEDTQPHRDKSRYSHFA